MGQAVEVSWEDLKEVVREEQGRSLHPIHDRILSSLTGVCRARTAKTR